MVVDDLPEEDKQRRRYLVYDCMMLAGEGISDLSFEVGPDTLLSMYLVWVCLQGSPVLGCAPCSERVRVCEREGGKYQGLSMQNTIVGCVLTGRLGSLLSSVSFLSHSHLWQLSFGDVCVVVSLSFCDAVFCVWQSYHLNLLPYESMQQCQMMWLCKQVLQRLSCSCQPHFGCEGNRTSPICCCHAELQERYKIIEKQLMRPVAFEKEFYKKAPNPK